MNGQQAMGVVVWMSHISTCNYEFYHSLTRLIAMEQNKKRIRNQTERSALTKK